MEKPCRVCGEVKPLDQFSKREKTSKNDGYRTDCKACVVKRTSGRDRREYLKKYYRDNPHKFVGRVRGPDAEYHRRYRAENPERIRAIVKKSIRKNKARRVAAQHARRSHPLDRAAKEYITILLRDPCAYCGGPAGTIDHIIPLSAGGTSKWTNLAAACKSCNSRKGVRSVLEVLLLA